MVGSGSACQNTSPGTPHLGQRIFWEQVSARGEWLSDIDISCDWRERGQRLKTCPESLSSTSCGWRRRRRKHPNTALPHKRIPKRRSDLLAKVTLVQFKRRQLITPSPPCVDAPP